jgi:hypothetical protein
MIGPDWNRRLHSFLLGMEASASRKRIATRSAGMDTKAGLTKTDTLEVRQGCQTEQLGWKANPHFGPFHILSFVFIGGGFWLIAAGWKVLYEAQRRHMLAMSGAYAYVRHPQWPHGILFSYTSQGCNLNPLQSCCGCLRP